MWRRERTQKVILPTDVPPQTNNVWPVTKDASGLAKNIMARATSAGVPARPTGIDFANESNLALLRGMMSWNISVSAIGPGATAFAVMPCCANSSDQVRARLIMPALVAE